jgi:malyl-CoA/(S)-citramalyl-CoA lyase
VNIGGLNPDYPGDQWHAAITGWSSPAAPMGCARSTGRSAISRIPRATRPPHAAPRRWAARANGRSTQPDRAGQRGLQPARGGGRRRPERIIEELKKAEAEGKGAASLDGKMIDAASEKMARNVIDMAKAIAKVAAKG